MRASIAVVKCAVVGSAVVGSAVVRCGRERFRPGGAVAASAEEFVAGGEGFATVGQRFAKTTYA